MIVLGLPRVLPGVIANIVGVRWDHPEGEWRLSGLCVGVNYEEWRGGSRAFSIYIIIHPAARVGLQIALYIMYRVMEGSDNFILQ